MPRAGRRGKRAEVIRHACTEYHAGRITFDELARVLTGVGGYDGKRVETCDHPPPPPPPRIA